MELNKQTRLAHLDDAMASHQDLDTITLILRWLDRLVELPDHGQMIQLG